MYGRKFHIFNLSSDTSSKDLTALSDNVLNNCTLVFIIEAGGASKIQT